MALSDEPEEVQTRVREIREEFPAKVAEVDRYVSGARFRKLSLAQKVEALTILRAALQDARRKAAH